jgi:hypothetical protein
MDKNICAIGELGQRENSFLRQAIDLSLMIWSGTDPATQTTAARPHPGPVLHRLPDLRKFGPSFR